MDCYRDPKECRLKEKYRYDAVLGLWLVETLGALYIARASLGLGVTDACRWAGLVALGGFGCTRQLLRLRGPAPPPLDRAKKN